jgi:MHS family alpha-ketoglutarate permease-like MFS transporter
LLLALVPLVLLAGYSSMSAIVKAELYPAHVRALGVAVPYAIAQAVFGGNAETTALYLKKIGHEPVYFWLVSALMVVGFVAALTLRDTLEHSRIDRELPTAGADPPPAGVRSKASS